jgi:hypothetical protein
VTVDPQARATAVAAKGPIGDLGGAWMSGPEEEAATTAAGLVGWQLYFLARHGVLGDVDPDVVTAAAFFFPAEVVRENWLAARRVVSAPTAVQAYLDLCHEWGRHRLAGFPEAERLAELAVRVVDGAEVVGLPLFAGWRALPRPSEPAARLAHLCQLLREHRGGCHGVAVVAVGLPPLVAVLANGGEANARDYGWLPPFPAVTDADRKRRERAEQLTDELAAPAYAGLDRSEQAELVGLLAAARAHAFPASPGAGDA